MVMDVDPDVLAALQSKNIEVRYLLYIGGKNRTTGDAEAIRIWTGELAQSIDYINPRTKATETHVFQPGNSWLKIPSIPQNLELQARSIHFSFSRLPAPVINAIRLYDPRLGDVWVHRLMLDPASKNQIAPGYPMFAGFINKAPIKVAKSGEEGTVDLECSSYSRFMTRTGGEKFSDEYLKRRSGDRMGRYLDVAGLWRIFWGEEETDLNDKAPRKPSWYRP